MGRNHALAGNCLELRVSAELSGRTSYEGARKLSARKPRLQAYLRLVASRSSRICLTASPVASASASAWTALRRRRPLGPELHARGLIRFTRAMPSFTQDLGLPDWEQPAKTSWPPQRAREWQHSRCMRTSRPVTNNLCYVAVAESAVCFTCESRSNVL
jgi:hypothetical protein